MTRPTPTVTVPVEPTEAVNRVRAYVAHAEELRQGAILVATSDLKAMLSAAPAAPQAAGVGEVETIARAIDTDALLEDSDGCVANPTRRDEAMAAARRVLALRAPSREPEGGAANDDQRTYKRLAQALSHHPTVMVVERSDPTLELTVESLEDTLEEVLPLATREEDPAEAGEWIAGGQLYEIMQSFTDRADVSEIAAKINAAIALRAQPQAREDAQPVAWLITFDLGFTQVIQSRELAEQVRSNGRGQIEPLYTHPAPDALRAAVKALRPFAKIAEGVSDVWTDDSIVFDSAKGRLTAGEFRQALAALQAEQKGGA